MSLSKHEIATAEKLCFFFYVQKKLRKFGSKKRGKFEADVSQQQSLRKHEVGPSGNMCKRIHSLRTEKWLGHTITRDILQEIYFLHCKRYSARDTLHIHYNKRYSAREYDWQNPLTQSFGTVTVEIVWKVVKLNSRIFPLFWRYNCKISWS